MKPLVPCLAAFVLLACGGVTNGSTGTPDHGGNGGAGGGSSTGGDANGGRGSGGFFCTSTEEVCDGLDNDCDGLVDEPMSASGALDGIDFTSPDHCGTCDVNCKGSVLGAWGVKCVPPPEQQLGASPGLCDYDRYGLESVDLDGLRSNGCEHPCEYAVLGHQTDEAGDYCGVDDDCDGKVDEDLCGVDACGGCDQPCFLVPHRKSECLPSAIMVTECSPSTRFCYTGDCESGWLDLNLSMEDGCEAKAGAPSASGPEVCDGWDNDGDGQIDEPGPQPDGIDLSADPSGAFPYIGGSCLQDRGVCRPGTVKCVSGEAQCVGGVAPSPELCDGKDNDCDGIVDNQDSVKCGDGFCAGYDQPSCKDRCADDGTCPTGLFCVPLHVSGVPTTTLTTPGCAFFQE